MYCPRDGKCPYNNFSLCGTPYCGLPECHYPDELQQALTVRIVDLLRIPCRSPKQESDLDKMRSALNRIRRGSG